MEGGHFFSDIIFACIFVFAFTYLLCSHYKSKIWSRENYYIVLGCVILVLVKIIAIASTDFNLYGDEAQYWLWSRDLSFGYFSKPPLLPWLISFVTYFFGDSFFILKTIPILLYIFSSFLIYMLATKLFKNRLLSFFCAMAFFLMPAVSVSSFLLSTDVVLILLWVASLIQVLNIKNNPHYLNFLALKDYKYRHHRKFLFLLVSKVFLKNFFYLLIFILFFLQFRTIICRSSMLDNFFYSKFWYFFSFFIVNGKIRLKIA